METEVGKHFIKNQKKLNALSDMEADWAAALDKCREHIRIRLKRRTTFGAHTETRLGEDPFDYYTSYAYEAILSGRWEWKDNHTLSEQMILIADSTISTEVEKVEAKKNNEKIIPFDDLETMFYNQDGPSLEPDMIKEILINKQISIIEEVIHGDEQLGFFWDCVKEGMKRAEIAAYLEISPKQQDKLRERFIDKIKKAPYFELE